MHPEIYTAIHERRRLRFTYDSGTRVVEPYAYGVGDGGRELLRAYQISGFSRSRERGWKLFHVDEMTDITLLEGTFEGPRLGYMRNDPSMTKIYCEL
jgi:predicted DNA-binding transcriptional regulator YafY